MKKLINILCKVVIFSLILAMVCPTIAHAEMTNDSRLKYYDQIYGRKIEEGLKVRGFYLLKILKVK